MKQAFDLAVVGAGPAGLAAATTAAGLGISVVLLDEQPVPGGQIYRGVENVAEHRPDLLALLGRDYADGLELVRAFRNSGVVYKTDATVWNISRELHIDYSRDGRSDRLAAEHVIVATGAYERPVPVPGWTLPGVTTVGGLQIILKTSAMMPEKPFVLAGSGPLLLLVAAQLVRAGAPPAAVVETTGWQRYIVSARHLPAAFKSGRYLRTGLALQCALRAARVPVYRGATGLEVIGAERAEGLRFRAGGRLREIASDLVALHQGVVPNQQLARLLECEHAWDARQHCFLPKLDDWFESSVNGVSVAGDGAGIAGARAAAYRGRISALGAAERLGHLTPEERDKRAIPERAALVRDEAVRPLLETLYMPPETIHNPEDDVVICRCEEVTARQLREVVRTGCTGPNQAKAFLRCGMGPCQGRLCGPTVTGVISSLRNVSADEIGYFRIRPPLKPLLLDELAKPDSSYS